MNDNDDIKIPADVANQIASKHTVKIKGLFEIFRSRRLYADWPFILSVILTILFGCFFCAFPTHSFPAVKEFSDLITVCFPCLLGFSLAGYVMVVAFPNSDLLIETSDINTYSLYQVLGAFFALTLFLQIITTTLGFCISWLCKLDINSILNIECPILVYGVNIFTLIVLLFFVTYSLLLTPFVVINLFSLSQTNSTFFTIKKYKSDIKRNEKI
jgi:hypothetical protein